MTTFTRRDFVTFAGGAAALAMLQACASPSATPTSTPSSPTDPGASADLQKVFETAFAASGLAGCAIRVRTGDDVVEATFGVKDLATGEPFVSTDYVRVASITKTFTATAILTMVDQGLIALDDTLDGFFPAVPNAGMITLGQMLGMRSGIFDFTSEDRFDVAFAADPTMEWDITRTLEVILRNEPEFEPGARVEYCDSNFALLGAIAETVDGKPLHEVFKNRVIDPAGLTDTYYPTDATIRSPHPQGYVPTLKADGTFDSSIAPRVVNEVNPAVPGGAGALISTLGDLSKWGDELVEGTLLSPESQNLQVQTEQFVGQTLNFGYGLGITNFNEYLGHDGAIFGFSSVILTRPETGTQIAIVSNESTNSTTPTLTMAVAIINEIDPEQGTGAR